MIMFSTRLVALCMLLGIFTMFPVLSLWAQEDGSSAERVVPAQTVPSRATTSTSSILEIGASSSPGGSLPVSTTSESAPTSAPVPTIPPVSPADVPTNKQPVKSSNSNMVIAGVIAGLMVLGGYGAYKLKTQKNNEKENKDEEKDDRQCFNLKKLMEEKLEELTDVKNQLKTKVGGTARHHIKEMVKGTTMADAIALVERAEKEYLKLKQLYEKCVIEPEIRKHVFIIHGCPSDAKKAMNPETRTYDKHWIPWVAKELIARGIHAETPLMPNPWAPDYETYKRELEKYEVTENTILVGHSCGCAFLVRWLGETKKHIDKLILVAPWKIADEDNEIKKAFYEYSIDETIASRVKEIILFTSDDEDGDGKKSLQIFHDALGGEIITLAGRGHYTKDDMGTDEFPELLQVLLK